MDRETESRSGNREAKKLLGKALGLDIWVLGLVLGPLGGITIFIATTWLIIRWGDPVGPHVALLGRYFIEYRVTLVGSLIGFVYAVVLGGLGGVLVGRIYNRALDLRKWRVAG